jgi:hypothetical protein
MTMEIPSNRWTQFFASLNTPEEVLVDVRAQSEGDMRLVAQGAVLRSLVFETGDACNNSLTIHIGAERGGTLRYQIVEPIRLVLRKEGQGDHYHLLEISAESGTTAITFRSGISPAVLKELGQAHLPPAA